jgi:hypothetical protein
MSRSVRDSIRETPLPRAILVVDGIGPGAWHLAWAANLAERTGGNVHLVECVGTSESDSQLVDAVAERLVARATALRARGIRVTTRVLFGNRDAAILQEALSCGAGVIVKQSEPRRAIGRLLRRRGDDLLQRAPCAVWLIPGE